MEFLEAAGFEKKKLPVNEAEEDFLVFSESSPEAIENLQVCKFVLRSIRYTVELNIPDMFNSYHCSIIYLSDRCCMMPWEVLNLSNLS